MHRPRILISTSAEFRDEGLRRVDSLTGLNYSQAVASAGGLPLMVASIDPELASAYCENAEGLLLSGGVDVDPALYGQDPAPALGRVDVKRDAFELALYRAARQRQLPVLGICRGIQLINVAEGGTLHQHVPALPNAIQHSQTDIGGEPGHSVRLDADSLLAQALRVPKLRANSYHHQAIDQLAPKLHAVGWSSDGLIEAIEGVEPSTVMAVQWHPEMSYREHPEHHIPFQLLIEAAARRFRNAVAG